MQATACVVFVALRLSRISFTADEEAESYPVHLHCPRAHVSVSSSSSCRLVHCRSSKKSRVPSSIGELTAFEDRDWTVET
jgi:hypothetical protein